MHVSWLVFRRFGWRHRCTIACAKGVVSRSLYLYRPSRLVLSRPALSNTSRCCEIARRVSVRSCFIVRRLQIPNNVWPSRSQSASRIARLAGADRASNTSDITEHRQVATCLSRAGSSFFGKGRHPGIASSRGPRGTTRAVATRVGLPDTHQSAKRLGLPDTHQSAKRVAEHWVWNPFTAKTLQELAGLKLGALSASPYGAWVSGTLSLWSMGVWNSDPTSRSG
jgi:hypothetical protein